MYITTGDELAIQELEHATRLRHMNSVLDALSRPLYRNASLNLARTGLYPLNDADALRHHIRSYWIRRHPEDKFIPQEDFDMVKYDILTAIRRAVNGPDEMPNL